MPAVQDDSIPARIGTWDVVRPLARGGMAAVYLVRRIGPGGFARHAAMKLVRPELAAKPELRAMFLDEARLAARIVHANVVHIEELGEHDGRLFLVMEYVPGVTLADFMESLDDLRRGLDVAMAVAIGARIAAGLHAAHETRDGAGKLLQVVHRDVSPQNVIVSTQGAVKLIDFGIASARDRLYQTHRKLVRGKLHYMSPEQLQGDTVDRRADVFSLGVVLWELLTQTRLLRGDDPAQIIYAIVRGELPPPGAFGGVPHSIDRLVMRMLAAKPDDRPASAREVRDALKAAMPDAFLIEDDEVASLLIGACAARLQRLPTLDTAQPFNTAELSMRPPMALEKHTRAVDPEPGQATIAGLAKKRSSPTESLEREPVAPARLSRDSATQLGVPGAPSREVPIVSRPSAPSPEVAADRASPVVVAQQRDSLPTPDTLPTRSLPIWIWIVAATLVGGVVGVAAWLLAS